jgi:hypothetical protein
MQPDVRFRRLAVLGRGSMGIVYRAFDAEMAQDVALKTLERLGADQLYRLKQEFRTLASVTHPNLVALHDLVVDPAGAFFTMELVDGTDLVSHVRGGADGARRPDLERLRAAAPQLVLGISALHAAGTLHRDVKPSNVLVTRRSRVVLVDFGLATPVAPDGGGDGVAGTPAYMAPEQLWGAPPSPAADWYAVGVLLYEALTGRLPFAGSPVAALEAKERGWVTPPEGMVPGLPPRLVALVTALLDPRPERRPGPHDILDQLEGAVRPRRPLARAQDETAPRPFVGRTEEVGRLRATLASIVPGRPGVVHVVGPSGIGKTELVRRFCSAVELEGGARVVRGRCHLQESVPFEAVDALVDGLSELLRAGDEPPPLPPEDAAALVRLFPVLARVPALAGPVGPEVVEPQELRRRGFLALRALCHALARERPLVLWIDDLQWGDVDSAALLRELLRPPDAPAVLLVVSYRSEERDRMPVLAVLDEGAAGERIVVGPLDADDAARLVRLLLPAADEVQAAVAREAAGSPFLIAELARHLAEAPPVAAPPTALPLGAVIADRLAQLPAHARDVLELVSVAGGPVERSLVLEAAELGEPGRPVVSALRQASLLRSTTVAGERAAVELYHDRLRDVVLAGLDDDVRRARHGALARVLATRADADPEALFQHWLGAGDAAAAGRWAAVAAERAATALAFDRAAGLYRRALELADAPTRTPELVARLATALANAGRGREAADRFLEAAAAADPAADADRRLAWRHRAAEQYLRTGHVERGMATTREVLATVGIAMPRTRPGTRLAGVTRRLRLELRGFRPRPYVPARATPAALQRLDACWGAAIVVSLVDQPMCEALGLQHLAAALDLGEPSRLLRALGLEAAREASFGGVFRRRSRRLLRAALRLGRGSTDPYDHAWCDLAVGISAYMGARWRLARRRCEAAAARWRARCTGVVWETVTADTFVLSALAHMGELGELGRRLPAAIADAEERGDVYAVVGCRTGVPAMHWLALDEAVAARDAADEAMRRWPTVGVHVQHYLHLLAGVQAELYLGRPEEAWTRIAGTWPALRGALLLSMESVAVELRHLRGRVALARAAAGTAGDAVALATAEAQRIARYRVPTAEPFALLLRAGAARLTEGDAAAAALLGRAAERLARADMALYAAAARWAEALLRGDDAGARVAAAAMQALGVRRPAAMAAMLVPGCLPPAARVIACAA